MITCQRKGVTRTGFTELIYLKFHNILEEAGWVGSSSLTINKIIRIVLCSFLSVFRNWKNFPVFLYLMYYIIQYIYLRASVDSIFAAIWNRNIKYFQRVGSFIAWGNRLLLALYLHRSWKIVEPCISNF